jgi:ornithine cyclodeaminase/alanine dehydrogenase-like protein (mu-crystallin family)
MYTVKALPHRSIAVQFLKSPMPLYLTEREVTHLLTMPDAINAVEAAFVAAAPGPAAAASNHPRQRFFLPGGVLHTMAAALPARGVMGTKTYTSFGHTTRFWVTLFSADTGEMLALIEADRLGQVRTGAATGVAARRLARHDVQAVTLYGAGLQAQSQAEALLVARPQVREFQVYSRDAFNRETFCRKMTAKLGVRFSAMGSAEEAAHNTEVFLCATTSYEPYFRPEWLSPGDFVAAVGANRLTAREIGEDTVARADMVVVDDVDQAKGEAAELVYAYERRRWSWEKAIPLAEVTAGRAARRSPRDIVLFKSLGVALEDVAVGQVVYEKARAQGIGREL